MARFEWLLLPSLRARESLLFLAEGTPGKSGSRPKMPMTNTGGKTRRTQKKHRNRDG